MEYNVLSGYDNEFQFVKLLNNKKVKELNPMSLELIESLFGEVNENSIITAWKNHYPQKKDILIKIDNRIRGVSIKKGSRNSVHLELVTSFIQFLKTLKIDKKIIDKYLLYHFGDGTIDGTGSKRVSKEEYQQMYQSDIEEINTAFNTKENIKTAVKRFVLCGNNSNFPIDGLVFGTSEDFFFLTTDEIVEAILGNEIKDASGVHFGPLFCQPQGRCLNHNPKYEAVRYNVQVKWYSLFDDIVRLKNKKVINCIDDACSHKT